jgi:allantoicase
MTDENPYIGQSYYRLKQTDFNGQYSYSEMVPVLISNNQLHVFNIYPNPATDIIQVVVSPQTQIAIFNFQGQLMKSLITTVDKISINVSAFPVGMYFVKVKTENGISVKKFVKD